MSYHVQVESNMSLTGANADERIVVKPSDQVFALINLYNTITGASLPSQATSVDAKVKDLAKALQAAGSKAVVMTGLNDKNAQLIALAINKALNSDIIDVANAKYNRQGNDTEVAKLVSDLKSGAVKGLITYNVDPVYTLSNGTEVAEAVKNLQLSVALSLQNDATANATQYALPTPHYLESWGDIQTTESTFGLMQPTIQPLFNTRQLQDVLLKWSGSSKNYYDTLKEFWSANVLGGKSWNTALHDGFFTKEVSGSADSRDVDANSAAAALVAATKPSDIELNLFSSTALGDGKQANNPWLQEFPDPLTRAAWDNYLTMSISDAKALGFENPVKDNGAIDGDYANVTVNGVTVKVPVLIQPGQAKGSVGLALGYGRTTNLKEEMQVGVNAYPLYANANNVQYDVKIEKAEGTHQFACTQVQSTLAGRHDILREASLSEVNNKSLDPKHTWNKPFMVSYDHQEVEGSTIDLWEDHPRDIGHHFNLSIDLTSCTGCGACVVACHAENNVPVVGKDEVRVGRDMHWLRIDRYYSSTVEDKQYGKDEEGKQLPTMEEFAKANPSIANQDVERQYTERVLDLSRGDLFDALENPAENPKVAFQPMMCQHCNHAPCETVCPVAATSHGRQGQNQMAYNRCVGTRYCANNCPYKVRRFNWFNYADNNEFDFNMNDDLR